MKRSELVKELADYLYNDWTITEGMDNRIPMVTADDIIDFIEKSGMLPPSRVLTIEDKAEYPELSLGDFYEYCFQENINRWEPEDEA